MPSNNTNFPNVATPTLKKTSISFENFGSRPKLGNVSPMTSMVSGDRMMKSLQSQRRVLERVIELEQDVTDLGTRVKMQDESLLGVRQSLNGIRDSVEQIRVGQQAIIENAKDKAKIEETRRKLEEQLARRSAKESDIESLSGEPDDKGGNDAPLNDAQDKAKSTMPILEKLKKFLFVVVGGWFTNKSIDLINAFSDGNKEKITKIGTQLLGGLAAVGGVMLLASGGMGMILGGLGSLIGVIGGLLFNPVTLTALLIAIGVGGAIFGLKKLFDWGREKRAGGKALREAHKKNNEKLKTLKEMGVDAQGRVIGSGRGKGDRHRKSVEEAGTPEQKAAWKAFKDEQMRLDKIRDDMNADIKKSKKEYFDEIRANEPSKKDGRKEYWKAAREEWKQKEAAIRGEHELKINKPTIKINHPEKDVSSKIGPEPDEQPLLIPMSTNQGGEGSVEEEQQTFPELPLVASGNVSNQYTTYSQSQYNVV